MFFGGGRNNCTEGMKGIQCMEGIKREEDIDVIEHIGRTDGIGGIDRTDGIGGIDCMEGIEIIPPDKKVVGSGICEILSDTGELYRNWDKGYGWIDSDRTKAIYGFTGKVSRIELTGVSFGVKTDFATIALSSLTDKPINSSDNILLTAVGRSENTGMKFNEERTVMLDVGRPRYSWR